MWGVAFVPALIAAKTTGADASLAEVDPDLGILRVHAHSTQSYPVAVPGVTKDFNIPAGPLREALILLGQQGGVRISFSSRVVSGLQTKGLVGLFSPQEALRRLLKDTGLGIRDIGAAGVVVAQAATESDTVLSEVVLSGGQPVDPNATGAQGANTIDFEAPQTIVVLDDEELEKRNVRRISDALNQTPNLNVTGNSGASGFQVTVRGISSALGNVDSSAPSVGFFLDGAPLVSGAGFVNGLNSQLVDSQAIEVFLGPQTTGFSRSTTAGAVNIVTNKPTGEFEGSLETEVGSRVDGQATAVLNVPIFEDDLLNARIVAFGGATEGFVDFPDGENTGDNAGVRASLQSKPINGLTIDATFSFDGNKLDDFNLVPLDTLGLDDPINFEGDIDQLNIQTLFSRLEFTYETELGEFSSNTSFREVDSDTVGGLDNLPLDISFGSTLTVSTLVTQEFSYKSNEFELGDLPGTISFNAGTSFNFSEFTADDDNFFGDAVVQLGAFGALFPDPTAINPFTGLPVADVAAFNALVAASGAPIPPLPTAGLLPLPPTGVLVPPEVFALDQIIPLLVSDDSASTLDTEQDVFNYSLYGDLTWKPVSKLSLTGGFRFSFDRIADTTTIAAEPGVATLAAAAGAGLVPIPTTSTQISFTSLTPSASISYDVTDRFTTYFSFGVGFRPGGVTVVPGLLGATSGIVSTFDEETTTNFEGGFRARLFDNKLAIAGSGFFTDFEDLQTVITTTTLAGPATELANAGSARSIGGELSVSANPLEGLILQTQVGYNDTEVLEFDSAPGIVGSDLINAPRVTFGAIGEYEHPKELLPGIKGFIRAEYSLRTDFVGAFSETPLPLDGYDIVNFRAGIRGDNFSIVGFIENAFDERFATTIAPSALSAVGGGDPAAGAAVLDALGLGVPEALQSALVTPGQTRRFGVVGRIRF